MRQVYAKAALVTDDNTANAELHVGHPLLRLLFMSHLYVQKVKEDIQASSSRGARALTARQDTISAVYLNFAWAKLRNRTNLWIQVALSRWGDL